MDRFLYVLPWSAMIYNSRFVVLFCVAFALLSEFCVATPAPQETRPNILWITSEDNGPQLGCYGDEFASTPNLDRLAARGLCFERAWSNAPVCAVARTTIITGMYATSLGAQHMRSQVKLPEGMTLFPQLLRAAGYYCTNNSKEDYNFKKPAGLWDESSRKAHWRNRREGQPFFAVINLRQTHEGQIRRRPHEALHDPAGVRVPAYHPDHPIVRQDWAQYYDKMSEMDARVGSILGELEEDGLAEGTIVFYYGDHGPGLPRCKRWPYDSGLRVPMIVHVPDRFAKLAPAGYKPGTFSQRLVSFVDLAPTVLSLAGEQAPVFMQGSAFAGEHQAADPEFLYGYRGRMDERIDLVRSVTDGRFVYIRNFIPRRPQGIFLEYMFRTPTTRIWKELYDRGELDQEGQRRFWEAKPAEELYDLEADPDEVNNLAFGQDYQEHRARLWTALREHLNVSLDLGFVAEGEIHRRTGDQSPRDLALRDPEGWAHAPILAATEMTPSAALNARDGAFAAASLAHRKSTNAALRYWGTAGLLTREIGDQLTQPDEATKLELAGSLEDSAPSVRIQSAEVLLQWNAPNLAQAARDVLIDAADLNGSSLYDALQALNAIDARDSAQAWPAADVNRLRLLPRTHAKLPRRINSYAADMLDRILSRHPPARVERTYKQVGDVELQLYIHQPSKPATTKGRPAVVFFHGGGWNSGHPDQFFDHCEHLARQGIVGISAAYRLKKVHGTTPYECVADGKSALRWVRSHAGELGIDPQRIGAGGGSAGGHVAAAVATVAGFDDEPGSTTPCLPNALILFNPVFDNGPEGYGHARVKDRWEAFSPAHNINEGIPPVIVFLGTQDKLIPVQTAERFQQLVRDAQGRCELRLYEGQSHGFFNRGRSKGMYAATVADMDQFLRSLGWMH